MLRLFLLFFLIIAAQKDHRLLFLLLWQRLCLQRKSRVSFSKLFGQYLELWSKQASHSIQMSCGRARAQPCTYIVKHSTL